MGILDNFEIAENKKQQEIQLLVGLEKKAKYFPIPRPPVKSPGDINTGRKGVRTNKPSVGSFN